MSTPIPAFDEADSRLSTSGLLLNSAQRTFEAGKAHLFLANGQPKYSPAEHERLLGELQAPFTRAIGATQELTAEAIKRAQMELDHIEYGDPFESLSATDQTATNTARWVVEEDTNRLTAKDLVIRLRLTMDGNNKAVQYLWARYVGQRIQAAASPDQAISQKADLPIQERQELATLVDALNVKVRGPEAVRRKEKAEALMTRARGMDKTSRSMYDEAHDVAAKRIADMARRYGQRV